MSGIKINNLTQEQEILIEKYKQDYLAYGRCTDRIDKASTEKAINDIYAELGKPTPLIIYSQSIMEMYLTANIERNLEENIERNIRQNIEENIEQNIWQNIEEHIRRNIGQNIKQNIRENIRQNIGQNIEQNIRRNIWQNIWQNIEQNIEENIGQNIWQNIGRNIWQNIEQNIRQNIWRNIGQNIEENIERNIWRNIKRNIGQNVEQNIWQNIEGNIKQNIWQNVEQTLWGQHSAHWICYYIIFRDILKLKYNEKDERLLNNLDILVKSCCWWIPFDNICIVSDRPSELKLDEQGRLHDEKDMCIKFVDGWGFHAIHGVRVPEYIVKNPEQITPQKIDAEENVEIRRIMIERYGLEKYFKDSKADKIHTDDFGTLYKIEQKDDEPIMMVKVVNSTPEADGHYKDYLIRVPPEMTTAHQAVAWTFGYDKAENYKPAIET